MNNIFILLGPTGSGKSKLSYQLADDFEFEIINADLFSIYKHLDIGTAKPSKEKLKNYQHFLFNKLEPNESYNVSTYCSDALESIHNILGRNKIPLIVGGSMMYVFQLLNGLTHEYNLSDDDLDFIKFIQNKYNNKHILKSIKDYNDTLVEKIDEHDSYRIEKLLERLISKEKPIKQCFNGLYSDRKFNVSILFIDVFDREYLKESLKKRSQKMLNDGLVEEVEGLKKNFNLSEKNQSMKAIGYKETLQFIDNKISIDQLLTTITVSTQQLAKRQITWKNKFKVSYPIIYRKLDYINLSEYIARNLK
tara:strand:+ start:6698 stop:7618 length:921 start_codon:yes stop_codon:yes gene_type:complete